MTIDWKGVYPALTTKFKKNDTLDIDTFSKNLDHQLAAGVHGLILAGSLGEASVLTVDEKEVLVKYTLEKINGKIPVIGNIVEGATRDAIHQANLAKQWILLVI